MRTRWSALSGCPTRFFPERAPRNVAPRAAKAERDPQIDLPEHEAVETADSGAEKRPHDHGHVRDERNRAPQPRARRGDGIVRVDLGPHRVLLRRRERRERRRGVDFGLSCKTSLTMRPSRIVMTREAHAAMSCSCVTRRS
jgi:hypothetical protein